MGDDMKTSNSMLRNQLNSYRSTVIAAREAVANGHQPPHGFDVEAASHMESIGYAGLSISSKCANYASEIRSKPRDAWDLLSIDSIITAVDDALQKLP